MTGEGLTGTAYFDVLRACDDGVSDYGRRFGEMKLRLWDSVIRRRVSEKLAFSEFRHWLLHGNHKSRDLETNFNRTATRMLKDAEVCIAKLHDWRCEHPGRGDPHGERQDSRGSSELSLPPLLSLLSHILLVEEHLGEGRAWRRMMVSFLTVADRAAIARVTREPRRWFVRRLEVLLGALRAVRMSQEDAVVVGISRACAKRIAGGRQPLWLNARRRNFSTDARRRKRAAYRVVLDAAEAQGWLEPVGAHKVGVHGRVFRFWLPGDDAPNLRLLDPEVAFDWRTVAREP